MKRYFLLFAILCICIGIGAIDIPERNGFVPSSLVGHTIIIPTYNGGDAKLNFVYNTSVLKNKKFNYQNYSSAIVLGKPIKITDYKILHQGKKNEILCLLVDVDNNHVVLAFPMKVRKSEFTESLIADLFYEKGESSQWTSSYKTYSIKDIDLHYYMADDIQQFNNAFLNTEVYLTGTDDRASCREYKFAGFGFRKRNCKFAESEHRFWISSYSKSYTVKSNNLDDLYAVLKGKKDVYIKIKENNRQPLNENSIAFSGLKKLIMGESDYRNSFKPLFSPSFLDSIHGLASGKEYFFKKSNNQAKGFLLSKEPDFNKYKEITLSDLFDHYAVFSGIQQIRTVDSKDVVRYEYYLLGKGADKELFEDYLAVPLNFDVRKCIEDGLTHRENVRNEEQNRAKANRERLAQIEREEKEYKNNLIKRYGQANAKLILNGEVRIGFTKAMCEEAWGAPDYINNTISSYGTWEQWVYGIGSYLYFSGNKLVVIQN